MTAILQCHMVNLKYLGLFTIVIFGRMSFCLEFKVYNLIYCLHHDVTPGGQFSDNTHHPCLLKLVDSPVTYDSTIVNLVCTKRTKLLTIYADLRIAYLGSFVVNVGYGRQGVYCIAGFADLRISPNALAILLVAYDI